MNLLELAAHLEEKAAQLRHEGLGQIKIALAGMDISSILEILQGYFGHVDSSESTKSAEESNKGSTTEEKTPEVVKKTSITIPEISSLATAELDFPLKSIPTVVAGLPKTCLPLHDPEDPFQISMPISFMYPSIFSKKQQHVIMFIVTIQTLLLPVYILF